MSKWFIVKPKCVKDKRRYEMNLYFELLKKPIFSTEDVNTFYNNMDSARSAIKRLMKDGIV